MAMRTRLFIMAAFGVLGTLSQTCTQTGVTPNTPVPGATPTSITMCIPVTAALTGAADSISVFPQPAIFTAATTGTLVFPAGTAAACTIATPWTFVAATSSFTYTLPAGCTLTAGTFLSAVFSTSLNSNPTTGLQYFTIQQIAGATTTRVVTSYAVGAPSPSPIPDTAATICAAVAGTIPTPQSACTLTQQQLATLAGQILGITPTGQGVVTCPSTTLGTTYVFEYTNPIWQQTISSTGARSATIYSWGNIVAPGPQMVALAITYPINTANLQALSLNEVGVPTGATGLVPARSTLEFLIRIERWTPQGVIANDNNPLSFIVAAAANWQPNIGRPITTVLVSNPCTGGAVALTGAVGSWAMSMLTGETLVIAQRGGLFLGYSSAPLALAPGSDEALLGLLALVALPFMCCCCLALWLWHRAKNAPFPCCQQQNPCPCPCPMQECAVQQCVPIQTVPVNTVPPCTPVFPMPYY